MRVLETLDNSGLKIATNKEVLGQSENYVSPEKKFDIQPPMMRPVMAGTREAAVKLGIIPEVYKDCSFDIEKVKSNLEEQSKTQRAFRVQGFPGYETVAQGLISTIISRKIPSRSYLIGAPNGFGKTSLANTCIIMLYSQGKICVPYVSLSELAEIRAAEQRDTLRLISSSKYYKGRDLETSTLEQYNRAIYEDFDAPSYAKMPVKIVGKFSWSEYMEASVLFCYFTDVSSKVLESEMLKTVLTVRGSKGLPTIVFISSSLNPYIGDEYLYKYVWSDILDKNQNANNLDRVYHVSCFKVFKKALEAR